MHRKLGYFGLGVLMRILNVGAVTGAVLWLHHPHELPQPGFLSRTELIGTWQAADGSDLVIQAGGTFEATEVCGAGGDTGMGSASGTWSTGLGEWSSMTSRPVTGGLNLMGTVTNYELDEGKDGAGEPVLWMFLGAPGDSPICELRKK